MHHLKYPQFIFFPQDDKLSSKPHIKQKEALCNSSWGAGLGGGEGVRLLTSSQAQDRGKITKTDNCVNENRMLC